LPGSVKTRKDKNKDWVFWKMYLFLFSGAYVGKCDRKELFAVIGQHNINMSKQ